MHQARHNTAHTATKHSRKTDNREILFGGYSGGKIAQSNISKLRGAAPLNVYAAAAALAASITSS